MGSLSQKLCEPTTLADHFWHHSKNVLALGGRTEKGRKRTVTPPSNTHLRRCLNHEHPRLLRFSTLGFDRCIAFGIVKRKRLGQSRKLEDASQWERHLFSLQELRDRTEMQDLPTRLG